MRSTEGPFNVQFFGIFVLLKFMDGSLGFKIGSKRPESYLPERRACAKKSDTSKKESQVRRPYSGHPRNRRGSCQKHGNTPKQDKTMTVHVSLLVELHFETKQTRNDSLCRIRAIPVDGGTDTEGETTALQGVLPRPKCVRPGMKTSRSENP